MSIYINHCELTGYQSSSSNNQVPPESTQHREPELIVLPSFDDLLKQTEMQTERQKNQTENQLQSSRRKVKSLTISLRKVQGECQFEQQRVVELNCEHAQLKNYVTHLENRVKVLERDLEESHRANQTLSSSIKNAVQEQTIMQSALHQANQKLANAEEEIYRLQQYIFGPLKTTIEELKKENHTLKAELGNKLTRCASFPNGKTVH